MERSAQVWVAGRWEAPAGAAYLVTSPASLKPLGAAGAASPDQWLAALRAAKAAAPDWARLGSAARAPLLAPIGERLAADASELALAHARESGQALAESLALARRAAAGWHPSGAEPPDRLEPRVCLVCPRPDAALADWAALLAEQLARGACCLVALPASAPLAVLRAVTACDGLPPGVLSVLVGEPPASVLGACERVAIDDAGAASDVVYIARDADLGLAAAGAAAARLYHSGQRAEQSVRVYVEASLIYQFADRLHEYLAFLEVGDAVKPATDLGPLASLERLRAVESQVAGALKRGALIKLGGRRYQPWGLTGYFFQPTLMIEGTGEERAPDDQIRGPVIILAPARDLAAVLDDRPAGGAMRVQVFAADLARACAGVADAARGARIEHVRAPDEAWFPYRARGARASRA